jgi:sulfonate transport system permease protein
MSPAARRLLPAALLLAVLALWQVAAWRGLPQFVLGPLEIAQAFGAALGSRELWLHAGASLARALPGFALGAAAGLACGLAAGVSRAFDETVSPSVFLTYPVPKIVLLPLFMLWFGIGDLSKVLIIALACFYPLFINA